MGKHPCEQTVPSERHPVALVRFRPRCGRQIHLHHGPPKESQARSRRVEAPGIPRRPALGMSFSGNTLKLGECKSMPKQCPMSMMSKLV